MDDATFITITNNSDTDFAEPTTTMMTQNSTVFIPHNDDESLFMRMNIFLIVTVFIIIFGLFGNFFTIIIMRREPFMSNSYGTQLTALAIADMVSLFIYILMKHSTIYLLEKDVLAQSVIVCKMSWYLLSTTRTFASSNLVYICVDRFIAVWFPFKARHRSTKRFAIISIGCMFAVANIVGIIGALMPLVKSGTCLPFDDSIESISIPVYAVSILYIIAPTFVLLLFTHLTVFKLVRRQFLRRRMTSNIESGNDQIAYMNAMLIGTLIAYIVLVSGPFAARLVLLYTGITMMELKSMGINEFIIILEQLNCACNFVIYGILCPAFRNQFIAICRGLCKMRTDTRS